MGLGACRRTAEPTEGLQGGVWDSGDCSGEKGGRGNSFPFVHCVLFPPSTGGLIHLFSTLFSAVAIR